MYVHTTLNHTKPHKTTLNHTAPTSTYIEVLAWSFTALANGVYPAANHHGASFADTEDIVRTALGGTDLMGGHRGALLEYRGDLKQFAEGVGIPHYASKESPCMFCHCTKASAHKRNVTHEPRTPQQYQTACFQQQIQSRCDTSASCRAGPGAQSLQGTSWGGHPECRKSGGEKLGVVSW